MKTLKIKISGNVQGVTFRQFVKENADKLSIKGFVRNLDDGRVEVVAEGKDEGVNEILKICEKGPKFASVKEIEFSELKNQGFKDFKISYI
ncbi:acylphosphatase [Candidatus Pacearchaeota archaeon]|nr:acylphosphatase [Candidatus Pacearchaeota archaeon]MBD3282718.1 acylphosphatase [Candidatus Pacearchaeota archaeon]